MNIKSGGPAFPHIYESVPGYEREVIRREVTSGGMTLRDYFAAKALAAMISKDDKEASRRAKQGVPVLAKFAYEYADAMLAARDA